LVERWAEKLVALLVERWADGMVVLWVVVKVVMLVVTLVE
jgi:hypothetical protein